MEDHEAEKLINLSLCKMASRGFRRGGSSLHKHLLIASVLTKARSAFFENWYMTDEFGEGSGSGTEEEDDEDDSTDESSAADTSDDSIDEDEMAMNNNQIVDPRLFVESEIELPADILSCVEKLGSLGDMDFLSHNNLSASVVGQSEEDMEASSGGRGDGESTTAAAEMYLELDATAAAPESVNNIDNDSDISLRNNDDSVTEDGLRVLSENSKASSASSNISFGSGRLNFKRRRVSESESVPVAEEGDNDDNFSSSEASDLINTAKRLRTSEMAAGEVFDADEKETDHFFGDGLDQTGAVTVETMVAQENKDRRVPCTSSSSNSSSDEEFEESMEVDQITNLVQYFSFSHQKEDIAKPATTTNTTPTTTNSSTASSSTKATKSSSNASAGLIRSVSSPDLCRELSNPPARCLVVTT